MQSIIVPTFRDREEVKDLLAEIEKTATGDYELIATCQKGSAAQNRNYGLDESKGDVIIMLDDDICDLPYGWNEELARPLFEEKDVVLVSARLMNPNGSLGLNMGGNYDVSKEVVVVDSGYVPTACIAFKKDDLRYDENYVGSGFEDTDHNNQMMQKYPKSKHVINNNVRVVHKNEMKNQRGENWEKNKAYYMTKWENFKGRTNAIELLDKKISLCMIVKNEEKNLRRCLDSAKDKVDEIIIVDTGSTDSTKDIIKEYGATMLEYEWTNDFAEARNIGLKAATKDWILVLDADEELVGSRNDLLELMSVPISRPLSYMVRIENIMDNGAQVEHHMARMFPTDPDIVYAGSIHEHVTALNGKSLLSVVTDKIKIKHFGYGSHIVKGKNKTTRNVDSLLAELEKNPDNAFFRYHLGITYRVAGEIDKAAEQFRVWHGLVSKIQENVDLSMGYSAYIGSLLSLNEFVEAKEVGDAVFMKCRHNPDFCLNYAIACEHLRDYDKAEQYLKMAINARNNKYPALSYDRDSMGWKAQAVLGNVYANKGEVLKAIEQWEAALKEVPSNKDIIRALANSYTNAGNLTKGEEFFLKLWELYPEERHEQSIVAVGNIRYNTGRTKEGLELFWELPKRKEYIDQLLMALISHQKYDAVKEIDDFVKEKEAACEVA